MDETMRSLLDEFVAESKEHLSSLEEDFLTLEKQKDDPDPDLVNKVFRAIHTIKGTSGFFGFEKITELSHTMENILSLMRSGKMKPESSIIDALLTGADIISMMVDDVEKSNEVDIEDILEKLNKILNEGTSEEDQDDLELEVELEDIDGNKIGFTSDLFTLKNIGESNKYLFLLKFELSDMTRYGKKTPVELINQLLKTGSIVDAKIQTPDQDLREGLPTGPLNYNVLYSTDKSRSVVQKKFKLGKDEIVRVNNDFEAEELKKKDDKDEAPAEEEPEEKVEAVTDPEPPEEREPVPDIKKETEQEPEPVKKKPEPVKEQAARKELSASESEAKQEALKVSAETGGSVRLSVELLDNLMRLASELVLVRNQQMRQVDASKPAERNIMQRLDVVTSELQETIMLTRMQPIGNIFNKFQRIVRELAKNLKKQIDIQISGNEVELDKTILENLTDPLTHIIRNSCDHGIETPAEREAAGKPPTGNIWLNAYHEGGQINIEIEDDGKGIDPEKIRAKALERGLKTESELSMMSNKDILMLVMMPGFSTADKVSDLSGRGVGMDVVRSGIEKLGGSIELDSTPGKGTSLHLRLPLTLAIIPCLILSVGEHRFALPQVNLEELVSLYDEDVYKKIESAGDREVYRLRDKLLPMIRLNEVLDRPKPFSETVRNQIVKKYAAANKDKLLEFINNRDNGGAQAESTKLNFAVLKVGSRRFGLIVDDVIGTEEIVVKPMHPTLKPLSVYAGATVMGDGSVAMILDVEGIARHTGIAFDTSREERADVLSGVYGEDDKQTVLLFKNGKVEQFAVALPLIRRIEKIKVSDIEMVGSKEFITVDGVSTRVLRLERVLNVSPSELHQEAFLLLPKHIKKPFGVLVSELIDIEDTSFELNTESYMEDGLLGTAIIRDMMTLFIDIYRLIEVSEPDWFQERRDHMPPPEENVKILLVEDSPFFRQLVKGYLEADGYDVMTAENGSKAFDLLLKNEFDLIISDLQMPVMDGFELIRKIKEEEELSGIPTMALTALDSPADKSRALESGYEKYEVKMERERFLTSVAGMLSSE